MSGARFWPDEYPHEKRYYQLRESGSLTLVAKNDEKPATYGIVELGTRGVSPGISSKLKSSAGRAGQVSASVASLGL